MLHWNVHGWRDSQERGNVDRVIDFVHEHNPDFVSLVEVDEEWRAASQIDAVARAGSYCSAFIPAFEFDQRGGFGNAVLSKLPFRRIQQRHLLAPSVYNGTEPSEPRTVLLVDVDLGWGPLTLGATHFPRKDRELRTRASTELLSIVDDLPQPFVICGDFNQPLEDWLDGDAEVVSPIPRETYPAIDPVEAIDYFLISRVAIEGVLRLESGASDHLPVLLDFLPSI
jgi:endonuclease/exonuclease/phosphatase family metal-dependent hydrolase